MRTCLPIASNPGPMLADEPGTLITKSASLGSCDIVAAVAMTAVVAMVVVVVMMANLKNQTSKGPKIIRTAMSCIYKSYRREHCQWSSSNSNSSKFQGQVPKPINCAFFRFFLSFCLSLPMLVVPRCVMRRRARVRSEID